MAWVDTKMEGCYNKSEVNLWLVLASYSNMLFCVHSECGAWVVGRKVRAIYSNFYFKWVFFSLPSWFVKLHLNFVDLYVHKYLQTFTCHFKGQKANTLNIQ